MARGLKFGIYEIAGLYRTICVAKTKALISFASLFSHTYANNRFSHVVAHFSGIIYLYLSNFCTGEFPLLLGAWDGLCYFIVALPGPSI